MSRTKRKKPQKMLSGKEQKYANKRKYKKGLASKVRFFDGPVFSQSGKKDAKKEKHRKERITNKKEKVDQIKELP